MFNYQARWDRDLPQDHAARGARTPEAGESIRVVCLFDKGKMFPQSFCWRNRQHTINHINFFWQDKQGHDTLLFFSVRTEGGTYEIAFSCQNRSWQLNKLIGP